MRRRRLGSAGGGVWGEEGPAPRRPEGGAGRGQHGRSVLTSPPRQPALPPLSPAPPPPSPDMPGMMEKGVELLGSKSRAAPNGTKSSSPSNGHYSEPESGGGDSGDEHGASLGPAPGRPASGGRGGWREGRRTASPSPAPVSCRGGAGAAAVTPPPPCACTAAGRAADGEAGGLGGRGSARRGPAPAGRPHGA